MAASACSARASMWASGGWPSASDDEMEAVFGRSAWNLAGLALAATDHSLEVDDEYWLTSQWAQAEALLRTGWEPGT